MTESHRSLTIAWDDPHAAFAASKGLSGIEYMHKMIAGAIAADVAGYSLLMAADARATAADGIVDDIISALSRVRAFFVISRSVRSRS